MEQKKEEYRLAVIISTSIYNFNKMLALDEKNALLLLQQYNEIMKKIVSKYNGNIIKISGDEILIDFKNTLNAVNCSIDIQKEISNYNQQIANDKKMFLRIGIHLGDIWFFENDAIGEGINISNRLQSLAKPGKICISKEVYNQILNKTDAKISDLGLVKLINISKEIYAYEINTIQAKEFSNYEAENTDKGNFQYNKEANDEESIESSIINKFKIGNARIPFENLQRFFSIPDEKLNSILNKLTEKGIITKIEKENGEIEYGFEHFKNFFPKKKKKNIRDFIEKKLKSLKEVRRSFIPNAICFFIFIPFMYFLNMKYSPQFWWFLFPTIGWGIGLIKHFFEVIKSFKEKQILENIPDETTNEQYKYINRIIENDNSIISHIIGFAGTNFLFYTLNKLVNFETLKNLLSIEFLSKNLPLEIYNKLSPTAFFQKITSPEFLNFFNFLNTNWYVIPLTIWGVFLSLYVIGSFIKKGGLKNKLYNIGFDYSNLRVINPENNEESIVQNKKYEEAKTYEKDTNAEIKVGNDEFDKLFNQALLIRQRILVKIESSGMLKEKIDSDIKEMLDKHIGQIKILIERNRDISKLYDTQSMDEIDERLEKLKIKFYNAKSETLKNEYERSIRQCEHHKNSYMELQNQKEIVYLRLTSAIMSLKQLEVDMTNMKEIISNEEYTSIKSFEEKSSDLSNYVDNLKQSYRNLERELE